MCEGSTFYPEEHGPRDLAFLPPDLLNQIRIPLGPENARFQFEKDLRPRSSHRSFFAFPVSRFLYDPHTRALIKRTGTVQKLFGIAGRNPWSKGAVPEEETHTR